MNWLVAVPVALPLVGAGLALAFARIPKVQRVVSLTTLTLSLTAAVMLLIHVDAGPVVMDVGSWAAPVGITLVADRLSALMLVTSLVVSLAVMLYSLAQGFADGDDGAPVAIYHPTFLVLSAGVSTAFISGDLFHLYVGFEVLLTASYVLITLGGTRERIRAGTIYVIVSMTSSMIFVIGIAATYAATGTLNIAQLAQRMPELDPGIQLVLQLLLLVGFAIKAAIFPLSAWLPDTYPTAPAPVTAVFAGLLTKVGIYAIIRTQTLLFPEGRLDSLLMVVAIATMIVGILGAVAQVDLKRMLSFTLVSHMGFMLWGISMSSSAGLSAAIVYAVHHITAQTTLFLVAGLIERRGGTTSLLKLGSLGRLAPLLAVLFFVPALNLAGIPPFTGFLGKAGLIQAGAEHGGGLAYVLIAAGLITSLLTLYVVAKAWNMAFWQEAPEELVPSVPESGRTMAALPIGMVAPAVGLVAVMAALVLVAGPLFGYTDSAATDLRARTPYVEAVLPDGVRGTGDSHLLTETESAQDAGESGEDE